MGNLVDKFAQDASLAREYLHLVEKVPAMQATRPAPVIFAHEASHVRTSPVFFNHSSAIWTSSNLDSCFVFDL